MKTNRNLLFVCLGCFLSVIPLSAASRRVIDLAGSLSGEAADALESRAGELAEKYHFDLVIVFDDAFGSGDLNLYAMDFFEQEGFGLGPARDGAIFYNAVNVREAAVLAGGRGRDILTPAAWDRTLDRITGALKNNDSAAAAARFLDDWEGYLALAAKGRHYTWLRRYQAAVMGAGWLLGLIIALVTVMMWKAGMNSAIPPGQAGAYITAGSLALTRRNDQFLYRTVSKTPRETQKSGGGGGYSSSRTSSSGRSYSGGSRRY